MDFNFERTIKPFAWLQLIHTHMLQTVRCLLSIVSKVPKKQNSNLQNDKFRIKKLVIAILQCSMLCLDFLHYQKKFCCYEPISYHRVSGHHQSFCSRSKSSLNRMVYHSLSFRLEWGQQLIRPDSAQTCRHRSISFFFYIFFLFCDLYISLQ